MAEEARRPDVRSPDHLLKAKYLDYCSARVAELLLELSPDDMYLLAEEAAGGPVQSGSLSYDQIVGLATARISRDAALPSFAEWSEAYRADPNRFDGLLLGFWRTGETE